MMSKINIFKDYRARYLNTLDEYDVSDNIKEVLWAEKQTYTEV